MRIAHNLMIRHVHPSLSCFVTTHFEKNMHFENFFQSALKIEQPQRTGTDLTHFEK
jgi:hypothetical protein